MTSNILDIIRNLNGGSIIKGQENEMSRVDLFSDDAVLYIDDKDSKYYFFADLIIDESDRNKNNMRQIEKCTINNLEAYAAVAPPLPNSSYLILFWKVTAIDESIYPQIINLEENEFFYKKYVFYFTQEELDAFTNWFLEMNNSGKGCLDALLEELSNEAINLDAQHIDFFIRLLIKIPFLDLEFPRAVLREFDSIVSSKLAATRGKVGEEIKQLDSTIAKAIASGVTTAEEISNILFKEIMEG